MSKILMSAQVDACERCASAARAALRDLCEAVYVDRLDAALAAVACCEIGGAALDHAEAAARRGWGLPNAGARIALPGLAPFWLDRDDATLNDVALGNAVASRPPGVRPTDRALWTRRRP